MSDIANTNVTSTGLSNDCHRGGCWLKGIVHKLSVCVPAQLKQPCTNENCNFKIRHTSAICSRQLAAMVKNNTIQLCNLPHCEYEPLHGAHDCPNFPSGSNPAATSTELVLYTGPDLVHIPRVETPLEDEPAEDPQDCPDMSACPIKGDHPRGTKCSDHTTPQQNKKRRSNRITLKMRFTRFLNRTRPARQSFRDDLVYWTARIPLVLGLINSLYALGMLHGTTASVMGTSVFNPLAVMISASFYALAAMIALDFTSKHQFVPSENSFNHYLNHIRTGTAFLATSCAFEVAVFLFQRR